MIFEKSIGAIVFRKEGDKIFYLLLRCPGKRSRSGYGGYFSFVKGHQERGETYTETMVRELKEETGFENVEIIPGFIEKEEYFFRDIYQNKKNPPLIKKQVVYFLVNSREKKVRVSFEHDDYKWSPYKEALKLLGFNNDKRILEKANRYLNKIDDIN